MLIQERVKTKDLLARLQKVQLGRIYHASFRALMRLQIFFTGRTHEMILQYLNQAQGVLLRRANGEGILDGARGYSVQSDLLTMWGDLMTEWQKEFQLMRSEAARIPFGVLAVTHDRMLKPAIEELSEAVKDSVFDPQLRILLELASEHVYGDGMNLSARIWRLDREAREGINQVLIKGIADGDSAWNIAKQLELFLGAGEDCPRWTSSRLYSQSSKDKVTSTTGLLTGSACDGKGVSYNALRLARTEIQKIHSLATDRIMAAQPWVEKEQCHLSASHPERDQCDDVVEGGEDGQGIYEKGTIEYPLHPHCFCFKTAVLMDEEQFTSQLNGWLKGDSWPEMDDYADMVGRGDANVSLVKEAVSLAVWLFGDDLQEWIQ